jgi:uncharacterized membrane protein
MSPKFHNFAISHPPLFLKLSAIQMRLSDNLRPRIFWTLNALLALAFGAEIFCPRGIVWLDAAFFFLAAFAAIFALNRQLPLQNVLTAAAITALIGGAAHGISAKTSLPFGPIVYDSTAGEKLFDAVPWTIPLLWIAVVFNSRGVGRLILRPWRKVKSYGYWLIALTTLLVVAFDLALEPWAWHVKHLWLWEPTKLAVDWHRAPVMNFVGWGGVTLLLMMFATPSLIRKQPGSQKAPDYHPLICWLGALLLFTIGAGFAKMWWPLGADVLIAGVTGFFAVRGARW